MLLLSQATTDAATVANSAFSTNFTSLDWVIIAIYMALPLAVGLLAFKFIHNVKGFVLGGGTAGTSLNIATYIGTGLGLVTLMYASIDAIQHGFAYVTLALIGFAVIALIGATGVVISPLRKMGVLTIPEYFEKRYSRRVRILGGALCVLAGVLNMGLFPKMGAIFLTYVTGLGDTAVDASLTINIITSLLIVLVLIYTVLGGMVSVIINDYIQFIVLSLGMALGIFFCLTHESLGWERMIDTIAVERGEAMFNPLAAPVEIAPKELSPEAYDRILTNIPPSIRETVVDEATGKLKPVTLAGYGWTWIVFNMLVFFVAGFCWAPESSRALTAKNPQVAKRTFLFSSPGQFARLAIPALWAVAAFTLISQTPELKDFFFPTHELYGMAGPIHEPAAAMPLMLGKIMPTGLLGLLVAGLLAAFLSTNDSYLLCWASVIARDIVGPLRGKPLTGQQEIRVIRISVVLIGICLLAWGIWYKLPDSVWNYMSVSGTIFLSGCGIALLGGIYWKGASTIGAYASMFTGLVAIAGLFLDPLNEMLQSSGYSLTLTMPGVGLLNYGLCAAVFIIFSLLFPDKRDAADTQVTDNQLA